MPAPQGAPHAMLVQVAEWEDYVVEPVEKIVSVGLTATRLFENDPDALLTLVQVIGSNNVNLGRTPQVSATKGFLIRSSDVPLVFDRRNHFLLPTLELWGLAVTAASDVYTLRLRRV